MGDLEEFLCLSDDLLCNLYKMERFLNKGEQKKHISDGKFENR